MQRPALKIVGDTALLEWGKTDENIQQTVSVIELLTARYIIYETIYTILYVTHDPCILTYKKIYS